MFVSQDARARCGKNDTSNLETDKKHIEKQRKKNDKKPWLNNSKQTSFCQWFIVLIWFIKSYRFMIYEIFVSQDARARCEKNDTLDLTRPPIQIKTK